MTKRVGFLGLMAAVAIGLFHPATASAQGRDGYRDGYVEREHRDWGRDDRWRDNRWREHEWREHERREWREHEWREHHERPYYGSYYGYGYGYRPPVFGFGYYGR